MARVQSGILDGFAGKVGTVVGGKWRGINYMRAVTPKSKSKRPVTDRQKAQHARFSIMRNFLQTMTDLLELGYKDHAINMTAMNSAFGYNLKNAITGNYPDFSIEYAKVLVTRGTLPNAKTPAAAAGLNGIVNFNWIDNTSKTGGIKIGDTVIGKDKAGKAKSGDIAILIAYCAALNETAYAIVSTRSVGTGNLSVPEFSGETVHTWISFISEDGTYTSTSIYTGEVNVV